MKFYYRRMLGHSQCPPRKPLSKIIWSFLGAFIGIFCLASVSEYSPLSTADHLFVIGSFGASAVLLYGAPLAEFSQPRNLIGGHVFSAVIGVTCATLLPDSLALSCALAVSSAIAVMHLTRTMHPPGGATALIGVIGSENVKMLGYTFVLSPVLLGATAMLIIALLINNLSSNPKRHYPAYWL